MPLDQVENFVEVNVAGNHSSTETTISLQSGEASNLPDPSGGEFNLVWFDSTNFSRPSEDSEVEIVRVTGRDTTNDTITVQRGQENTTAVAHDTSNSDYVLILAQTAKMIEDVDDADFSTNSLTVAGNSVALGQSTAVDYIDLNDTGSSFPIPNADLSNSSVSVAGNSVSLGGSTNINYVDLNDTGSSFPISNSDLGNSSLTVAGNSVALGGRTAVNHSDLSNIGTGDHHTRYTNEEAQDAVGGILNADFSYDDVGNSIALASNSLTVAGNTVALGGSTAVEYIDLNDTGSSFPIPNSDLSNSSINVADNSVSLGGSTSIASTDLSDSGSIDANTLQGNQPSDLGNTVDNETISENSNGDLEVIKPAKISPSNLDGVSLNPFDNTKTASQNIDVTNANSLEISFTQTETDGQISTDIRVDGSVVANISGSDSGFIIEDLTSKSGTITLAIESTENGSTNIPDVNFTADSFKVIESNEVVI